MADLMVSDIPSEYVIGGVQQSDVVLGLGSYGMVFEGHWRGTKVAIKRHHVMLVRDEYGRLSYPYRRFLEEFPMLKEFPHPNIVQVFGMVPSVGRQDTPGLVMEYLPVTLRKRYDELPLLSRLDEATVSLGVASALDYLHSRQVVHRDLTTNNIMICAAAGTAGEVTAKVTDVGGAAVLSDGVVAQTMSMNPGAQTYMAPETQRPSGDTGRAKYGSPADCYSYAVSIMSMCNRLEPPDLFAVVRDGRAADIQKLGVDHPFRSVIVRCLETDPALRPTASDLCREVADIQSQLRRSEILDLPTARAEIASLERRLAEGRTERAQATAERDDLLAARDSSSAEVERLRRQGAEMCDELDTARRDLSSENEAHAAERRERSMSLSRELEQVRTEQARVEELEQRLREAERPRQARLERLRHKAEVFQAICIQGNSAGMLARCFLIMPQGPKSGDLCSLPKWHSPWRNLPDCSNGTGSCMMDGQLYIVTYTRIVGQPGCAVRAWSASKTTSNWTTVRIPAASAATDPAAEYHFFSHNSKLYLVGSAPEVIAPQCIWRRDDVSGRWAKVAELFDCRVKFGMTVMGDRLIVAGGAVSASDGRRAYPDVLALNLVDDVAVWAVWPDWPLLCSIRLHPNVIASAGRLHVLGGEPEAATPAPVLTADLSQPLPLDEHFWSMGAVPASPKPRCGAGVVLGDVLVICCGSAQFGRSTSMFMFHPGCGTWLPLPDMPVKISKDTHRPSLHVTDQEIICVSEHSIAILNW